MRHSKTVIALFMMLLGFTQVSCASHHRSTVPPSGEPAEEMEPAAPSSLRVFTNPDAGKGGGAYGTTACAVVRDRQHVAGRLKERLDRKLTQAGFQITEQPSRADRIVEVEVVSRGRASDSSLRGAINQGFGTPVSLHQGNEAALVADVLLVRRRAHTEGSKADLKNISARNTTGSSKFRLGVIAGPEALESRGLEQALAGRVAELATSESYQQSHRRSTEVRRSQSSSSRRSSAKSRKSSKSSRHSGSSRSRKK